MICMQDGEKNKEKPEKSKQAETEERILAFWEKNTKRRLCLL
jgi:hypothetical protein